ncbi:hypothetical protein GCM10027578_35530 [Spirosoma luteolum]
MLQTRQLPTQISLAEAGQLDFLLPDPRRIGPQLLNYLALRYGRQPAPARADRPGQCRRAGLVVRVFVRESYRLCCADGSGTADLV